jgi:hypothetical protein
MCEDVKGPKQKIILDSGEEIFIHITPKCDHDFQGWREFKDGNGGETVCTKCGVGAMSWSLRNSD